MHQPLLAHWLDGSLPRPWGQPHHRLMQGIALGLQDGQTEAEVGDINAEASSRLESYLGWVHHQ
jgi:hypothetical protein